MTSSWKFCSNKSPDFSYVYIKDGSQQFVTNWRLILPVKDVSFPGAEFSVQDVHRDFLLLQSS